MHARVHEQTYLVCHSISLQFFGHLFIKFCIDTEQSYPVWLSFSPSLLCFGHHSGFDLEI